GLGGQCGLAAGGASDLLAPGAGEDRIVPGSGHLGEDRARYASVAGARPQSGAHDRPGTAGDPLPGKGIPDLIWTDERGRRAAPVGVISASQPVSTSRCTSALRSVETKRSSVSSIVDLSRLTSRAWG